METNPVIAEAIRFAESHGNLELGEKLRELSSRLDALQAKAQMKAFGPNNYFYRDAQTDGPYCPVCWQRDRKAVLLPASQDYPTGHERYCQVCKTGFFEGPRKQPLASLQPIRGDWPTRY
jgi:hypothetical protein